MCTSVYLVYLARFDSEKFCSEDYSMMHAINECADLPIEMIKRTNRYIFSNIVCSSCKLHCIGMIIND